MASNLPQPLAPMVGMALQRTRFQPLQAQLEAMLLDLFMVMEKRNQKLL